MVSRTLCPALLVACFVAQGCSRPAPAPASPPAGDEALVAPEAFVAPDEGTAAASGVRGSDAAQEAPTTAVRAGDAVMLAGVLRSSGVAPGSVWTVSPGAPLVYVDSTGRVGTATGPLPLEPADDAVRSGFDALTGQPVVIAGTFALREGSSGPSPTIAEVMTVTLAASPDDPAVLGRHVAEGSAEPPP